MADLLNEAPSFLPHAFCLLGRPLLLATHAISDLLITLAYFFISGAIIHYLRRKQEVQHKALFYLFATFIAACGLTHLLGAITLWAPIYYVQGMALVGSAFVSVATALYLRPQMPNLLALPSRQQLLHEIARRRRTQDALQALVLEKESLLAQIRESEARFRVMADSAPVLIWLAGSDARCTYFNQGWLAFTGQTLPQAQGDGWISSLHPDDKTRCLDTYREAFAAREPFTLEYRLRRHDGEFRWLLGSGAPRFDEHGRFSGFVGSCVDITDRKRAELAISAEESLRFTASIFQYSREGMMVTDADGHIVDINPAFTAITGYALDELIGKRPSVLKSGRQDAVFYLDMWQAIRERDHWQGEIWNRKKNGDLYAEWLTINVIRKPDGSVHRYVASFSDITEKKRLDEEIHKYAHFDPLTDLPNRLLFRDRLEQAVRKSKRSGCPFALLFIDLDRFKVINDTLGHDLGDCLLVEAAGRIKACVRESDTVARMGGDEFTVILPELHGPDHADPIVAALIKAFDPPFMLEGHPGHVSASIGVTFYPQDADNVEDLIRNSDQAMYNAKHGGRNRFSYYAPSMRTAGDGRQHLIRDLRAAMDKRQFRIFFSPSSN